MIDRFRRPLSIALGALATTALGGCYYGGVNGAGYASNSYACETRYGAGYYDEYDPYAYDDGYGYDCYDGSDYGSGFVQIGFGGGWYDDYYYPGYGMWMFDNYRNRYPLNGQYLNYWGGRRAWWRHHGGRGDGNWNRPGRGDQDGRPGRPGRPGGWNGNDRDNDGPRGNRPPPPGAGNGNYPPGTANPVRPGRPDRGPGAGRPRPPRDGNVGSGRPRPPVAGNPGGVRNPLPPRGQGAVSQPRPAPVARPAPAARPAPVARPAPADRVSRADRGNNVRED